VSGRRVRVSNCNSFNSRVKIAAALLIGAGGCASTPDRPESELAMVAANIDQAQQAGAAEYSAAELAAAQDKLAKARAAADRDETVMARRLAEQAALDAELANAMTRSRKAESAVDELNDTIEALRNEIERNQSGSGEIR
jgi:predicted  nucleic acid-binding Zn-ribbon protein